MSKLSCFSMVFGPASLEESIKRIAKLGFSGVALIAIRPHAYPPDLNKDKRKHLLNLLKSLNLEVSSVVHHGVVPGLNLSSPNEKIRREAVEHLKNVINLSSDLECKIAMILPGWLLEGESCDPDDAWKWAIGGLKECVPLAEKQDITIAIEACSEFKINSKRYTPILDSTDDLLRMIEEIGSKNIKVCLDVMHLHRLKESITEAITRIGEKIACIHIWDTDSTGKFNIPCGKGEIDFNEIIKALKQINYNGYLELEGHLSTIEDGEKYAYESKVFLDKIIKNIIV